MSTSNPVRGNNGFFTSAKAPTSSTLTSLLAQANSLNSAGRDSELPQIRLGIDEIERMSQQVAGRGKRPATQGGGEGYGLLSDLGINTSHLSHTIAQLPSDPVPKSRRRRVAPNRMEPLEDLGPSYAMSDGDIGAWGRNQHEMIILSGIEMQRQRTIKAFQQQFQQRMLQNWETEKARVLRDELGATEDELDGLRSSSLGQSTLGSSTRRFPKASTSKSGPQSREGSMVMHSKMMRYERVISTLNQKRLRREPYELCQALEDAVKGDTKYPLLPTAYRILAHITLEPTLRDENEGQPSSSSQPYMPAEPVNERQYAMAYLSTDINSSRAAAFRGRMVSGGRRFLERDFETHIEETIKKNTKEAELGGRPGIAHKIQAFIRLTQKDLDSKGFNALKMGDKYPWVEIYYLLRCGYREEAFSRLSSLERESPEKSALSSAFRAYLDSPERRLPKSTRDQLYNEFNTSIRNNASVDQFKYAMYKIVGRFELGKKNIKVATTTEDWIWLQMCLIREGKDEGPQEQYDLNDLARSLNKIGNNKFDDEGKKPFAWFNLLLFSGQFERAVAYLHSKPSLRTDAVHFAIILSYYGLLRVPYRADDVEILYIDDAGDREIASLNFHRVVKMYITPFANVEPQTALQYAYLVALSRDAPDNVGDRQQSLASNLVVDVILASRSWAKLLGSVRSDGSKETGLIEREIPLLGPKDPKSFMRNVVRRAAEQSSHDASLLDSIELYDLAEDYDKVVETVNHALGKTLSSTETQPIDASTQSMGLSGAFGGAKDLYGLAQKVHQVYGSDSYGRRLKVDNGAWDTLNKLLSLKLALAQYEQNRADLSLETFKSTNLLPLDNDPSSIGRYVTAFRTLLDQPSISNLDQVIIVAMKCLHDLSTALKQSPYGDHGRMTQLGAYKQQAQCLVQFASGLRLRLGSDVYRQLSSSSAYF